jgi:hypothetical protein
MTRSPESPPPKTPASPRVDAAFGAGFILVAIAIVVYADPGMGVGPWLAGMAVGGLGLDALIAGARGRRSLLSRIGPLP